MLHLAVHPGIRDTFALFRRCAVWSAVLGWVVGWRVHSVPAECLRIQAMYKFVWQIPHYKRALQLSSALSAL